MIVEDDMIHALDLECYFESQGYEVVVVASSPDEALSIIRSKRPHAASLDYNLGSVTSTSIARQLKKCGVRFVYVTSRAESVRNDNMAPEAPILEKPVDPERVCSAIAA